MARIFDVIGLISPFTIIARIILQHVWHLKVDWDFDLTKHESEIAKKQVELWIAWKKDLANLGKVSVPRAFMQKPPKSKAMIGMCDASEEAYAEVIFLRVEYDDHIKIHLVTSNNRVTPSSGRSLPQLELLGALIVSRKADRIRDILEPDQEVFFTDSVTVLSWLEQVSKTLITFVCNRVAEIQRLTKPDQWRHIRSKLNSADHASRGLFLEDLIKTDNWWKANDFMLKPIEEWPQEKFCQTSEWKEAVRPFAMATTKEAIAHEGEETCSACGFKDCLATQKVPTPKVPKDPDKRAAQGQSSDEEPAVRAAQGQSQLEQSKSKSESAESEDLLQKFIDPARVPTYGKLLNRAMLLLKPLYKLRKSKGQAKVNLYTMAESMLVRRTQEEVYVSDIKRLHENRKPRLAKNSPLRNFNPIIDDLGVLRANSRVGSFKTLAYNAKRPMLLPAKNVLTYRLLDHIHRLEGHLSGVQRNKTHLRSKFCIPRIHQIVKKFIKGCVPCQRVSAKPTDQIYGEIDSFRASAPLRAFAHTSLDCYGPYLTKIGRGIARAKRWVLLATCAISRAVHLEVLDSLDTDDFLSGFWCFVARRGCPIRVRSDNGGNFVKGESELRKALRNIDWSKVQFATAERGVQEWLFSEPFSPHHNSLAEAMVKCAKKAMNFAYTNRDLKDSELRTIVTAAEGLLNSRPLFVTSDDTSDPNGLIITPNHFLYGQAGGQLAPNVPESLAKDPTVRWKYLHRLTSDFWTTFMSELIPSLHGRPKWREARENLQVGDLVILFESKSARGVWPLARVVQTYPGRDNKVRSLDVKVCHAVQPEKKTRDKNNPVIKESIYHRNVTRVAPVHLFSQD